MPPQSAQEERLLVRAFGPVAEADLAIRDLTVFIGPQASGKSLTAQLLYFMRGIEELAPPGAEEHEEESHLLGLLRSWMDPAALELAISEDSSVSWRPRGDEGAVESAFSVYRHKQGAPHPTLSWDLSLEDNEVLEDRLAKTLDAGQLKPPTGEQQIYVPAGRILCSLLPPGLAVSLLNRKSLRWPGFLAQFYATMEEAIEKLPASPHSSSTAVGALAKSASSLRGTLSRGRNHVRLTIETRDGTQITTGITGGFASGQLESWPLWALIQAHLDTPEVKRIFIEEPEAHLHPAAQRDLVETLVVLLRHRFRFVVTTHSPYILYALNNALMAGKVRAANRPLPAGFSDEFVLTPAQVSAYRFAPDGVVRPILDEETALLDAKDLDDPAGELGGDFARLQDALDAPEAP